MPDVPDRDKMERSLARQLGKLGQVWIGKVMKLLGDPPDINNLTDDMWSELGAELEQVVRPFLVRQYEDAASRLITVAPGGVEWGLVHEQAVDWSKQYSFDLVTGINGTTRRALQKKIPAFFDKQMTMGELRDSLQSLFGPVRADMIAATEVTRAAVQGEKALIDNLAAAGIEMVPFWQTNNDDLVCPVCGPRNGKQIRDGQYPPIHVRCRCWVNWAVKQ